MGSYIRTRSAMLSPLYRVAEHRRADCTPLWSSKLIETLTRSSGMAKPVVGAELRGAIGLRKLVGDFPDTQRSFVAGGSVGRTVCRKALR